MSNYDYDIGIIGGGSAGLTVAAGAAQFGAKALLIEKSPRLGGDCLHYGCVPSKTLIRTAGVWALARRAQEFGLPGLELPEVDLGAAMDRVAAVIAKIQEHDSPERFCKLGAEVRFGPPRFVDDHTVEHDGKRLTARAWVVATGSRPALPPVEGLDAVPYWTNETVFSQRTLPAQIARPRRRADRPGTRPGLPAARLPGDRRRIPGPDHGPRGCGSRRGRQGPARG